MKWSLLELRKYSETPLTFNETLDLKDELLKREYQILDLAPVKVSGNVSVSSSEYILHYLVETTITLPSTRSLEPVQVPMNFKVDEVFMTPEQFQQKENDFIADEILIIDNQTLNLDESVADNILLAIPLQVLSEEEKQSDTLPQGNDWIVVSEEDFARNRELEQQTQIDPRLAKLSSLLEDKKQ